ncbi:hypothetical protein F2P81_003301 [Scophthalmus maximus]|uniref:Uncharacterized protein n=1 Tax=Scophthalmus maximus TaxID=52904 RepID=A0A6A4TDV0_SCOMX|nr:hypothetical protein F2P81_003301 [Scophthalmus maximus]
MSPAVVAKAFRSFIELHCSHPEHIQIAQGKRRLIEEEKATEDSAGVEEIDKLCTAVSSGPDTAKEKKQQQEENTRHYLPILWCNLENIKKTAVMYHRQKGRDRFCYEFSLLHIPP